LSRLRIAVDTGGTFTDFVVLDEATGAIEVFKVSSTRGHEADGIVDGTAAYLARMGTKAADIAFFSHGTTVGTNAILEGKGAKVGLFVTEGFRGIYEVGEQSRPYGSTTYDLFFEKPAPLVTPFLTAEVPERIVHDGSVLTEFDEAAARRAIATLLERGMESAAVSFLFSFRNPEHERRLGALLAELAPHVNRSLSSDVAPQIREYYRLSTTVVNAYLNPLLERYIVALGNALDALGMTTRQRYIMRSNGGVASFDAAANRSVQTILSGPAAGVVAASRIVAESRFSKVVTFDMGGTSTDVALIENGQPVRRMGGKVHGRDVLVPMLDIHTVAAGGGTLAWIDSAGELQVGPASAGAQPGPAAYGRGGTQPTITDANVVLGLLSEDNALAGGTLRLDRAAAERAIKTVIADPLGITVEAAARGIVEIINVKMQEAIKVVSSNRGFDLRDFHLLAFGGAGPLHAAAIARELGMRGVLVPAFPGAFSALGLLLSDVRQDYVISELGAMGDVVVERVTELFARLSEDGTRDLVAQGFGRELLSFEYRLDMRYAGQGYELTIPVPELPRTTQAIDEVRARFDAEHDKLTGHSAPDERVEIVNYRVTAVARVPQASIASPFTATGATSNARTGSRITLIDGERHATTLYDRTKLAPGATVDGPAILLQDDSTTVIHAGQRGHVVELGQLEIV
jgi:N-methylhydantoinase A